MNAAETRSVQKAGASASKQHSGQTIMTPSNELLTDCDRSAWKTEEGCGDVRSHVEKHTSRSRTLRGRLLLQDLANHQRTRSSHFQRPQRLQSWAKPSASGGPWAHSKSKGGKDEGARKSAPRTVWNFVNMIKGSWPVRKLWHEKTVENNVCLNLHAGRWDKSDACSMDHICVGNGTFKKPCVSCNCLQQVLSTWPELCPPVAENTDVCRRV